MFFSKKFPKKKNLKIHKSQIEILVLNQRLISAVCWGPKNRTIRGIPLIPLRVVGTMCMSK